MALISSLTFVMLTSAACTPTGEFRMDTWSGAWGSDGPIFTGDLNGDGKTDVFMWRDADKTWSVNLSTGFGFVNDTWTGAWGSDGPILTGDLNGDGKTDVFMWRDADKTWSVNLSTGTGFINDTWTGAWGSDGPISTGDLNGDGKIDVFMWRDADKTWSINLSTGAGFQNETWTGAWGSDGPILTGDLNGDHLTDVFMWREADHTWSVNLSLGSGFANDTWTGAWGSDGPMRTGDFNADGKTDVAMWRASSGDWTVNLSYGQGFTAARWTGQAGADTMLTGDLNGDHRTDVFVWRDASSDWAVNLSTGSGFREERWTGHPGTPGPVLLGDLDGDGKTDAVTWKDASKQWTMNLSTWLVRGELRCIAPDGTNPPVDNAIGETYVSLNGQPKVLAGLDGKFRALSAVEPYAYDLRVYYDGAVSLNRRSGATPLQVMDDGHGPRSDILIAPLSTKTGRELDLGHVNLHSIDCEVWRDGYQVLADYQSVTGGTPAAGRLRLKRWDNVVVGTPLTFYDYITVPTDFLTDTEDPWAKGRESTIAHEFGHVLRHVADGDETHWHWDNIKFIYAQDHSYDTIHNKGFAFNEGWADFWEQARWHKHHPIDISNAAPGAPPDACTTADHRDWNEARVANRLLDIWGQLKATPQQQFFFANTAPPPSAARQDAIVDALMLQVLIDHPYDIHSLNDFERMVAPRIPGFVVPSVGDCPADFTDDGLFCRRNADTISKPANGHCPCGYHDNGPTCFRHTLIFPDR